MKDVAETQSLSLNSTRPSEDSAVMDGKCKFMAEIFERYQRTGTKRLIIPGRYNVSFAIRLHLHR